MPLGAFRGFGAKHQKTAPPRPYTLRVGADRGILMRKKSGKFGAMKNVVQSTQPHNPTLPWIVERLSPGWGGGVSALSNSIDDEHEW